MKKRLLLILISLSVCASGFSQDMRRLFFTAKAGASFGGSRPGSYNDNGEANLMINFTGAVGLSYFFANDWQVCLDIGYIRKGINCEVQPTDEIMDVYLPSHSLNGLNTDVFAWADNTYLEIPLTIGYTWGYDICRTRIGGYVACRMHTKTDLLINGMVIKDDKLLESKEIYKDHYSRYDAGIKIANEFYLNRLSVGLEFSAGFVPVIRSQWRVSESQSYTMSVGIYLGYTF